MGREGSFRGHGELSVCVKTANRYSPVEDMVADRGAPPRPTFPCLDVLAQVEAVEICPRRSWTWSSCWDGQWISHPHWAAYIGSEGGRDPPADHKVEEVLGDRRKMQPGTEKICVA